MSAVLRVDGRTVAASKVLEACVHRTVIHP